MDPHMSVTCKPLREELVTQITNLYNGSPYICECCEERGRELIISDRITALFFNCLILENRTEAYRITKIKNLYEYKESSKYVLFEKSRSNLNELIEKTHQFCDKLLGGWTTNNLGIGKTFSTDEETNAFVSLCLARVISFDLNKRSLFIYRTPDLFFKLIEETR